MTLHHIFQKVDRILRNRPDALRWRVTMSSDAVEVFRRPILTSAITLGALGLTDAPMPVPVCVVQITLLDNQTVNIVSRTTAEHEHAPTHTAVERVVAFVNQYRDPSES